MKMKIKRTWFCSMCWRTGDRYSTHAGQLAAELLDWQTATADAHEYLRLPRPANCPGDIHPIKQKEKPFKPPARKTKKPKPPIAAPIAAPPAASLPFTGEPLVFNVQRKPWLTMRQVKTTTTNIRGQRR